MPRRSPASLLVRPPFSPCAGLGSIALVLSTAFQSVGGWFYMLTLLSPGAWVYYMQKGTREEEVSVSEGLWVVSVWRDYLILSQ